MIPFLLAFTYTARAEDPPPPPVAEDKTASITFDSGGQPMTVAVIDGQGSGTARTTSGATATVTTIYYHDLCTTPCNVAFTPGFYQFSIYGDGVMPASGKYDLRPGQNALTVQAKPTGPWLAASSLLLVGLGGIVTGATLLGVDSAPDRMLSVPAEVGICALGAGVTVGGLIWRPKTLSIAHFTPANAPPG